MQLNQVGQAAAVAATYQNLTGTVRQVGQVTPMTMPFIVMAGSSEKHTIDLNALLHLPQGDVLVKSQPLGGLPVAPGDSVTIRTNPKTGRVFEMTK